MEYESLKPDLQISFYYRLKLIKDVFLQNSLKSTIEKLEIKVIDDELNNLVDPIILRRIASFGLRGEIILPVPSILKKNPRLIGYYRLLYGLSQKEFYSKGPYGCFKKYEDLKRSDTIIKEDLYSLCKSLIKTGEILVNEIDELSKNIINELQILTLGPQFRGSRNTELGKAATQKAFALIKEMVELYIISSSDNMINIQNDSKRIVTIQFASDPDISIVEQLQSSERNLVSIEIKGGTDFSNIHNRLGEAEKSHQKAKDRGFFEFWTIINVNIDYTQAKKESPTTSCFFNLDKLHDKTSKEFASFRDILSSILSIRI